MQYLRHIHAKILFMVLPEKFNQLISCILFENFGLNLTWISKLFIPNSIFFICFKKMDNNKAPLPRDQLILLVKVELDVGSLIFLLDCSNTWLLDIKYKKKK